MVLCYKDFENYSDQTKLNSDPSKPAPLIRFPIFVSFFKLIFLKHCWKTKSWPLSLITFSFPTSNQLVLWGGGSSFKLRPIFMFFLASRMTTSSKPLLFIAFLLVIAKNIELFPPWIHIVSISLCLCFCFCFFNHSTNIFIYII